MDFDLWVRCCSFLSYRDLLLKMEPASKFFQSVTCQDEIWQQIFISGGFVKRETENGSWKALFKKRKSFWFSRTDLNIMSATFQKPGGIRCLDQTATFLFCGCSNGDVIIIPIEEIDRCKNIDDFPRFGVLAGHRSWIYSICAKSDDDSGVVIIATCSRDRTVRLSRIGTDESRKIMNPIPSEDSESTNEVAVRL